MSRPGNIIVKRRECRQLEEYSGGWLLVYGRRKTGKTWLLRRCIDWDVYATVTSTGECIVDSFEGSRILGLEDCMNEVVGLLRKGDTVVLDEFQRLPQRYWDYLATVHSYSEGLLIACGSSMGIASKVFDRRSPLLGLFQAFRVDLASIADTIASLHMHGLSPREAVLWAPLARDPWILAHVPPKGDPWTLLAQVAPRLAMASRGLVGEVFEEEERSLTRTYDAVLQMLAEGAWSSSEIAHRLYTMGLASNPQPGSATSVLAVLESMGLVERIPLWRTRGARIYYRHRSSLVSLLYYMLPVVEANLAIDLGRLRSRYGLELQFNLGELLAEAKELRRGYSMPSGNPDIDVLLLDQHGKPRWGYEVKIGVIGGNEALKAVRYMHSLGIPLAGIVSVAGKPPQVGDEQLGPEELVGIAYKLSRISSG